MLPRTTYNVDEAMLLDLISFHGVGLCLYALFLSFNFNRPMFLLRCHQLIDGIAKKTVMAL